jgi:hypothetical protein
MSRGVRVLLDTSDREYLDNRLLIACQDNGNVSPACSYSVTAEK